LADGDKIPNRIEVLMECEIKVNQYPRDEIISRWKDSIKLGDLLDFRDNITYTFFEGVLSTNY
jgi:hypothetical protein